MQHIDRITSASTTLRWGWMPLIPPFLLMALCWLALWLLHDTFIQPWPFQALFAVVFVAFCWALLVGWRLGHLGSGLQISLVLGGSLLLHMLLLPAPYAFSDDIFRYIWNGRVSAAGIDPYRFAPGDPVLAPLRDSVIWPFVNAKEQPSPYPPLLEGLFALVYRIAPENFFAMKAAMSLLNLGVVGVLLALLQQRGLPLLLAIVYAWNPQVIFQVAFGGHNEPLMLFWLLLALLFADYARLNRSPMRVAFLFSLSPAAFGLLAGWALALATLSKVVPLVALPFLLVYVGWRAVAVYALTMSAAYGALLWRGQHVFRGVLYEASFAQFNDGAYYLFYRPFTMVGLEAAEAHTIARFIAAACFFGIIAWLLWRRPRDMATSVGVALAAYVVLTPSVAPWYAMWVLPFVALHTLPRLVPYGTHPYLWLFGSYWLLFSGSVNLSELYYFVEVETWRVAHLLVYALPVCAVALAWLYQRRAAETNAER
ncbi:MAG: hypothetical protein MUD01_26365 [Chloroflexaceae bacterium]|nr:hypothetical protein [Chloroflexaceae bacterium]